MKQVLGPLIVALCLTIAAVASATTVVKLDFDELVAASDKIVVGQVTAVTPFAQKRRVFTRIEIGVDETLKGEHTPKIEIVHVGGRTEKLVTRVHGMPSFVVGERALLFLEQPENTTHYVVTGLAQGKIGLDAQASGPPKLRHPDPVELQSVAPKKLRRADEGSAPRAPLVTLDDARARVASLLAPPSPTK